jgi:hypothetical protein
MMQTAIETRATSQATSTNGECRDLADSGRRIEETQLRGDESLFKALVSGCHVENAAVIAGVSERTAYRRLADPEFRKQLQNARKSLRESVLAKLADAGHDAIGVLTELMHSGEEETTRLKAAKAVLDTLMAFQRNESSKSDETQKPSPGRVVLYLPDNGRNSHLGLPGAQPPLNLT